MPLRAGGLAAIGLILFVLSITAFALQPATDTPNLSLPSILLCLAILWLFMGMATHLAQEPLEFGHPDTGAALLLFSGTQILIMLVIRLVPIFDYSQHTLDSLNNTVLTLCDS